LGDRSGLGLAAALIVLFSGGSALAQPAAPAQADTGVTSYGPDFFAEYRPTTAMAMLGLIPGFTFDGGNSSVRGFAGAEGNVLIDGKRPPSRGDSLSSVLDRIPASAVLRIDIVRGGAGGLDMQGHTYVANVIRRQSHGLTGSASGTAIGFDDGGVFRSGGLQIQRHDGPRTLDGSLSLQAQDLPVNNRRIRIGPDGALLLQGVQGGNNSPRTYTGTGAYETPLGGGSLRINLRAQRQQDHYKSREMLIVPGGEIDEHWLDHQTSGELGLRYTRKLPGAMSLEVVGFQRLFNDISEDHYRFPDSVTLSTMNQRTGESIANAKISGAFGKTLSWEAGVEGAYNFVDERLGFFIDGDNLNLAGDLSNVDERREEGFVTTTWKPRPKLSLEAGLRYEHSVITANGSAGDARSTFGYLKPRLVATWTPTDKQEVQLKVERIVQQLSFDAFAASASFQTNIFGVGNTHIEPEKDWNFDARYAYRFAKQGSFSVEYTHQEIYDLVSSVVIYLPSGGVQAPFTLNVNLPHQSRDVVYLNTALPLDDMGFSGAVFSVQQLWRHSQMTDSITGLERRIGGDRPYEWNVSLVQNLSGGKYSWNVSANGVGKSRGFAAQQNGVNWYDPQFHAGFGWKPNDKLSISLSADNFAAGHNYGASLIYFGPRALTQPLYREDTLSRIRRNVTLTIRRGF